MKHIILILQCLCTIWLNTVIIILILQGAYGSLKEAKQLEILIWQTAILHLLIKNQTLLAILLQMGKTEKK